MHKKLLIILISFLVFFLLKKPSVLYGQSPDELATCLRAKGFVVYGKADCPNCDLQKSYFGESFSKIKYIECSQNRQLCADKKIRGYPTWEDAKGNLYPGAIPLDVLAKLSGCAPNDQSIIATQSSIPTIFDAIQKQQYILAFIAGFLSFFAPCCLPLFPTYFSIITGFTFAQLYGLQFGKIRSRVFLCALFFVTGFVVVYTLLGAISSVVGKLLEMYLPLLLRISGLFLIILGIVQLGIIKFHSLEFDYAWNIQKKLARLGYITALMTGIAAALSWIPCIGPLLSPILLLAAKSETVLQGSLLLFIYSLGLTTPFLLGSLFFPPIVDILHEHRIFFHRISQSAGLMLIGFGSLLLTGRYQAFIDFIYTYFDPVFLRFAVSLKNKIL